MTMSDILQAISQVMSKLPKDEAWLFDYLKRNLQQLLMSSTSDFNLDAFYDILGQDHQFDNTVTKMMLEILLSPQKDILKDGDSHDEQTHCHADEEKSMSISESLDSSQADEHNAKGAFAVENPSFDELAPVDEPAADE